MNKVSPVHQDARLQDLLDKDAIRDVIMRYTRGIDRFDLDLARSVFHPDSIEMHGPFEGRSHDWIDMFDPSEFQEIERHHCLGQSIIELRGDVAFCETYVVLARGLPRDGQEPNLVLIHARYVDRFERRDGEWKIAHRNAVIDYASHLTTADWEGTSTFIRGKRYPDDLVYQLPLSKATAAG
jgi:ketosteroid isomerase-like protein